MGLNDGYDKGQGDDHGRDENHGSAVLMAPFWLAAALGLLIGFAALVILWQGLARPEAMHVPPLAPPAFLAGGASALVVGLLAAGLLLLGGIFVVLLLLLLCMCGCGGGALGRLLALLLPGLARGLRRGSEAFGHAARVAQGAVEPLHEVGTRLTEVGATLADIKIPRVAAQTTSFWNALRRAMLDSPAHIEIGRDPPENFPNVLVLSSFSIDTEWRPLGGQGGIGWWVTLAGEKTYGAGDGAGELAEDCRTASAGLGAAADAVEAAQNAP